MIASEVYAWWYEQPDPPRPLFPAFVCSVLSAWASLRVFSSGAKPASLLGAKLMVWR